jgi:hypothetical protein
MSNKVIVKRVIAVLKFPANVSQMTTYCKEIVLAMTGNTNIPTPFPANVPALANMSTLIASLDTAQTLAQTKVQGSVEARDVKKELVKKDMRTLRNYVQTIADNNPTLAEAIIISTGMSVKKMGGKKPKEFGVENTSTSGIVSVFAPAIKANRGAHEWQYTTDVEHFTQRVAADSTTDASTEISGLVPGTKYAFFHKAITPEKNKTWDGPVFMIVT